MAYSQREKGSQWQGEFGINLNECVCMYNVGLSI